MEAEKIFAKAEFECERCSPSAADCSLHLRLFVSPPVTALSPPSLAPIKGRSLLPERRTRTTPSLAIGSISELLLSSSSRLAACTARRDSRPPKPHLLSHVREKGDKVFGERSAQLLAASSRTIRSPTTTSPTTTSSPTSTTSSTTWQARTPTPSLALLLLLSRACSSPFYYRPPDS